MKSYLRNYVVNNLISVYFFSVRYLFYKPFVKKTLNPLKEQTEVLNKILGINIETEIGEKYKFSDISSYEEYKNTVPVHTFEKLRKYLDCQRLKGKSCLTMDKPIMYVRTSGTTDKPKLIPVFHETVKNYKRSQSIANCAQYMECPGMFDGKILAITSRAIEGETHECIPYGSLSGMIHKNIPKIIRSKYILPYLVFDIDDYDEKYFLISALAISNSDITTLAAVNPSTILKVVQIINSRFAELIDIVDGIDIDSLQNISRLGKKILKENIISSYMRANELKNLRNKHELKLTDLWPDLKAVITWTQGNCSMLIPKLKQGLDESTKVIELGYFSSEFRGTVLVDTKKTSGVPVIDEIFYEFISVDDWENEINKFMTIDQIEDGKMYYIIVTTPYGLYRYFINDIIEVTGRFNNTPEIKFVRKGTGVTNITGEKLYEDQVVQAINNINEEYTTGIRFFLMLADTHDMSYELLVECANVNDTSLCTQIDNELKRINLEYRVKRDSGRLKPLTLRFIKVGTGEIFKNHCIHMGQRDHQFKYTHITYSNECSFDFREYMID